MENIKAFCSFVETTKKKNEFNIDCAECLAAENYCVVYTHEKIAFERCRYDDEKIYEYHVVLLWLHFSLCLCFKSEEIELYCQTSSIKTLLDESVAHFRANEIILLMQFIWALIHKELFKTLRLTNAFQLGIDIFITIVMNIQQYSLMNQI